MTRAEQHLIVAGAMGPSRKGIAPKESWYNAFDLAMIGAGADWQDDPIWGRRRTIGSDFAQVTATITKPQMPANETVGLDLPPWAIGPPPPEPRPSRPLAPSLLDTDDVLHPPALSEKLRAAAERGKAVHRLLQLLPSVATGQRRAIARQWLAGRYAHWTDAMITEVATTAAALIDDPQFALLFGDNALAEAPLVAIVEQQVISAVVDVMVIEPERILLVDYKTGHHVPADAHDIPAGYLRQMAAYVAAAQVIFPGRAIAAALLYTGGPTWIDLPPAILAAHKPVFQRP
jgi:ATP-dependent helicase/nuclease subunit A